jgi:hypothetical protein
MQARRGRSVVHIRRAAGVRATRLLLALCVAATASTMARAAEVVTVTTCPSQTTIPVKVVVDCSHVKDDATRRLCVPFAANQACKVFPAYRRITGIRLEQRCSTLTYRLYDKNNFPHGGIAGGMSYDCRVDYMAQYALLPSRHSQLGPYDVHEILHHYQMTSNELAGMTAVHPLFVTSMLEAEREIGDSLSYESSLAALKAELPGLREQLKDGTVKPKDRCALARAVIEDELYLQDRKNVYRFYNELASVAPRNPVEREAKFNAMLNDVSGGNAKEFLTKHGCAPF